MTDITAIVEKRLLARRVVELLSDKAVRDIAWEVVPEYAERLVRERIAEVERAD